MSELKAIVFDFDGVILESADVKTRAFVELYADRGAEVAERVRAYHLENLGISRFKKFAWIAENILGEPLTPVASVALGERFTSLALAGVLAAPFVPGADRSVPALGQTLPLFVASGTPDEELKRIVTERQITPWFREVHGTPREKPAILRDLLERLQLRASQVLFIGDGMTDYRAAMEVGTAFLARDTPGVHQEWLALGVRRVPDLTQLEELVRTW